MSCCNNAFWKHLVAKGLLNDLPHPQAKPAVHPTLQASAVPAAPDFIYHNGRFHLAYPAKSGEDVGAVAVTGSTISDCGDATRILGTASAQTQIIDLQGQTLVPGFVEAHAHIIASVQTIYSSVLSAAHYPTIEDVTNKIQADINGAAPNSWLFYMNFDPSLLPFDQEQGFPQLGFDAFNAMSNPNDVCVFVENASGHIAYANQPAFTAAGVTAGDNPGDGGRYGTYTSGPLNGQLNGVMFEPSSFTAFLNFAPQPTGEQVLGAMLGFLSQAQRAGVTTVADPAVGIGGSAVGELALYLTLKNDPTAKTDIVGSLDLTSVYSLSGAPVVVTGLNLPAASGATGSYHDLVVPNVKIWADGSTQGYTGYLSAPYLQPVTPEGLPSSGVADWTQSDMNALVQQAKDDNWSVLIHCNGDKGLDMGLTTIQTVYGTAPTTFRNRIEHCTVTTEAQYDTMQTLGVTPSYLNNHIAIWGDAFNDYILGNARASRLDAAADAIARGMIFSFHCDYATSNPAPLTYMQTAIVRKTPKGVVLGPSQSISSLEALKAVTIYPAQQLGIDKQIGTISVGKDADFVWLKDDPFVINPATIGSIPIVETMLKGRRLPVSS